MKSRHFPPGKLQIVRSSVQMLGVWEVFKGTLRYLLRPNKYRDGRKFDKKYGTDTNSIVEVDVLNIPGENQKHAVPYYPLRPRVFRHVLKSLEINYSEFVFVDVGSGKGRNILLASHLPFRKLIGIEASPVLHEIAQRNLEIYESRLQKCKNLEVMGMDALDFDCPKANTVFFLYNPFREAVMRRFLQNIECSLREHPRRILIVYVSPRRRSVFDEFAFLKQTKEIRVTIFDWSWCLWENTL